MQWPDTTHISINDVLHRSQLAMPVVFDIEWTLIRRMNRTLREVVYQCQWLFIVTILRNSGPTGVCEMEMRRDSKADPSQPEIPPGLITKSHVSQVGRQAGSIYLGLHEYGTSPIRYADIALLSLRIIELQTHQGFVYNHVILRMSIKESYNDGVYIYSTLSNFVPWSC